MLLITDTQKTINIRFKFRAYVHDRNKFQDSWNSNYTNSYFGLKTTQIKGYYFRFATGDLVYFGKVELLINKFIQCARNCTKYSGTQKKRSPTQKIWTHRKNNEPRHKFKSIY